MANGILKTEMLENVLQRHWADILDHVRLMRMVMEDVRDTPFREIRQAEIPPRQVKLSVTKVSVCSDVRFGEDTREDHAFELWVEFSIPKAEGVVVGTNIYLLSLTGDFVLRDSFGTYFRPEN